MRFAAVLFVVTAALAISAPPAHAQKVGAAELGIDAGVKLWIIDNVDDNLVNIGVPFQTVRVGFMTSESVEIEVKAGYQSVSQGGDSIYDLGFGVGVLAHFPETSSSRPFIRFGAGVSVAGIDGDSYSQLGMGAALGSKLKLGPQWALRAEIGGERKFETNDLRGRWDLGVTLGLSFFTNANPE